MPSTEEMAAADKARKDAERADRARKDAESADKIDKIADGIGKIGNVLDAALYGYAPHEIDWQSGSGRPGAGTWAADVVALAEVVACSVPPAPTLTPQPPAHVTLPVMVMSADGSMPLVS